MNRSKNITNKVAISILLLLLAGLPTKAQMQASHEPTNATPTPAGDNGMAALVKPVARVNGTVLTQGDLLREMYAIFPYAKQHNAGFPKIMEADIRRGALKMIEFEELVYQEAKRRGMVIAPDRLAQAEKKFRAQFQNEQDYHQFVNAENNGSVQNLRTKIARSLLIEDLLKLEVNDKSWVSITEAKAYYEKNPQQFELPESYSLQTITIMPPVRPTREQPNPPAPTPEQLQQMRVRAEDALRQAKASKTYEEFGVLAERISEDDYRVMMGKHDFVDREKLPPEVVKAALAMQPGQVSDLIQVEQALTIVRLIAHNPAGLQKFDAVKDSLHKQLQQLKTEQLRSSLDKQLRAKAKVEVL